MIKKTVKKSAVKKAVKKPAAKKAVSKKSVPTKKTTKSTETAFTLLQTAKCKRHCKRLQAGMPHRIFNHHTWFRSASSFGWGFK